MNIGATIRKVRRSREMTQEDLAEFLNVSVSAVSQWESEKTTPDISMIPAICSLLNISSDELLGIDLNKKKEKIEEISKEANSYSSRGYHQEARDILQKGLKEFPDSYELLRSLMYVASFQQGDHQYSKEEREEFLEEAIKLGHRILDGCTDDSFRHGAIQILCFSYADKGDIDKAVELAHKMSDISCSSDVLLSIVQKGTKGYRSNQSLMFNLFQSLENNMVTMNIRLDSGELAYTQEEMATLRDKQIALFHLMFENNDFGFFHTHICDTHKNQATYYAKTGNHEKTLEHLRKASEHAIEFIRCGGKTEHTSLVFRGFGKDTSFSTNNTDNDVAQLYNAMKSEAFNFIRTDLEFKRIEDNLREYAGKWSIKQ